MGEPTVPIIKKQCRTKGFHMKYYELCKLRNSAPLPEVKAKNKNINVLDFHADRVKVDDWLAIIHSLQQDNTLQFIAIRLRKNLDNVLETVDNEKKARAVKNRPVILTKFLFSDLIDALSNCLELNQNLNTLILEGLPISNVYTTFLSKGLSKCAALQNVSFARSALFDEGCESMCSTIKLLPSVESVNFSQCQLSAKGAESISEMIKYQKIFRYSEGWKKSLRYRDVDPETIPGLKRISLNHNPDIGDTGLMYILEVLKEDVWIKALDLENCGLSEAGSRAIIDCLELNDTIVILDIRNNPNVPEHYIRHIQRKLGADPDEIEINGGTKAVKLGAHKIKEKIKFLEQQLAQEIFRRKQMENLNEQLHKQMLEYQKEISMQSSFSVPDGYTLVKNETLQSLLKERDELSSQSKTVSSTMQKTITSARLRRRHVRKAKSEITAKTKDINRSYKISKSECGIGKTTRVLRHGESTYVEKNIGDTIRNRSAMLPPVCSEKPTESFMGIDALKIFVKKKTGIDRRLTNSNINPKSLFMGNLYTDDGGIRKTNTPRDRCTMNGDYDDADLDEEFDQESNNDEDDIDDDDDEDEEEDDDDDLDGFNGSDCQNDIDHGRIDKNSS